MKNATERNEDILDNAAEQAVTLKSALMENSLLLSRLPPELTTAANRGSRGFWKAE